VTPNTLTASSPRATTPAPFLFEGRLEDVIGSPEFAQAAGGQVDAVVCDPPYEIGFLGAKWDKTGVAFQKETWEKIGSTVKPGGYVAAFGFNRNFHRLACAMEDAGLELRGTMFWLYGEGMPKSRALLKPSYEPIVLARVPGPKVLHLGIEECRFPGEEGRSFFSPHGGEAVEAERVLSANPNGRWPGDVLLSHKSGCEVDYGFVSTGCADGCPVKTLGAQAGVRGSVSVGSAGDNGDGCHRLPVSYRSSGKKGYSGGWTGALSGFTSTGGEVSRFFGQIVPSEDEHDALDGQFLYANKVRGKARPVGPDGETHLTVKPLELMEWLVKLVVPRGGSVLDPFAGSGTTGIAAWNVGRSAYLIERDAGHAKIIRKRISEKCSTENRA
jgi:hypothetical protein